MITLHHFARSSASFRVRIALNLKGLEYRSVLHDLDRGAHRDEYYLAINPQGLLPTLEYDGVVVTQSLAIIEYLEETFPPPVLLPPDPVGRAWVRSLAQMISSDTHALLSMRAATYLRSPLRHGEADIRHWQHHWLEHTFSSLEERLALRPMAGPFCHGESPGLADLVIVPQAVSARRIGFSLEQYLAVASIVDRCLEITAFRDAAPEAANSVPELTQKDSNLALP